MVFCIRIAGSNGKKYMTFKIDETSGGMDCQNPLGLYTCEVKSSRVRAVQGTGQQEPI